MGHSVWQSNRQHHQNTHKLVVTVLWVVLWHDTETNRAATIVILMRSNVLLPGGQIHNTTVRLEAKFKWNIFTIENVWTNIFGGLFRLIKFGLQKAKVASLTIYTGNPAFSFFLVPSFYSPTWSKTATSLEDMFSR